ncbi:hypothetical protein BBH88_03900 [Planococcus antarcticus DSM 14505]|uniref:Peptidoglycan binding-like domain-containing protein n=1 Tax=Planococcus antarcticus DSM 14505 TaxID=1185653 RepID=A0ABN4RGQ4_9BACL|nr:peptidoglycan-binding protein [Planococcus antarcticus]ANU09509.1 hypothetical protein BBH88_03900 [Planococcus antarcticus DSM 14505]
MNIDNQLITTDSAKRWIEMLQKQLIRENPAALPNDGIDGIYGAETTEWVTRFQQRKGLYVDGIAGAETLERLRTDIVFYVGGPSGKGVELLQEDLEYFYLSSGTIDDIYGAGTRQSVRDFQADNNLFVDGEAGPGTMKKMDELLTTLFAQSSDTGSLVRRIQEQLNEQESTSVSVYVDGIYGSATKNAITQFQTENNLYVDGIVGPRTMHFLDAQAQQLMTSEEIQNALESRAGFSFGEVEEAVATKFISLLEENSVFTGNLGTANLSSVNAVTQVGYQNNGMLIVYAEVDDNSEKQVMAFFDEKEEELLTFSIIQETGSAYDDLIKITNVSLTENGEGIEEIETTVAESDNQQLLLELEFKEAYEKALSSASIASASTITLSSDPGEDPLYDAIQLACGSLLAIGAGVSYAKIATILGVTTTNPVSLGAILTAVAGGALGYYFCQYLESPLS